MSNPTPNSIVSSKKEMYSFFLEDPKEIMIEKTINGTKIQYLYFNTDLDVLSRPNEIINGCLLSGKANIIHKGEMYEFSQFDFFFLPPGSSLTIHIENSSDKENKIFLYYCPIEDDNNLPF